MKRIGPDERVPVTLTAGDRDLLLEHALLFEPLYSLIGDAVPTPRGKVTVSMTADDLDELIGHVAAAANHPATKALERRLDDLYDRLTELEHGLDVQG